MKVEKLHDQDPRYGWVSIDPEGDQGVLIIIHSESGSLGFMFRDGEMKPTCICSAYEANECACPDVIWNEDED